MSGPKGDKAVVKRDRKETEYERRYKEIEIIGRGQQGSAVLIENKADGKRYISKKILLNSSAEKEQAAAIAEVKRKKQ